MGAILKLLMRRTQLHELAELDARALKDVGLEPWRSPLGARIEQERQFSRLWAAARIGLY